MTTTPAPSVAPRLRVALLHNYRDEQQPSMRLYADRLGQALVRRNVALTRLRPPAAVPAAWRARSATWNKIDGYLGRFAVYPRLLRGLECDIAHVVDHGQGYLVGGLDPRRTVVTCHDVILLVLASGRIGAIRVPLIALQLFRISLELMKRAAVVVADSTQTKRDLVDFTHIDPGKVTVIHPGLNQAFSPQVQSRPVFRSRFGFGTQKVILQIGRGFYKNLPCVIRVLQRLRADGINAVDVLLFPSLYEGFGWPPLEAMASGTPVVCSRAGSLDEVIADAALTADPEDVDTLAWHVGGVLTDDQLRSAMVARGLAHAGQFSWDKAAAQMIDIYQRLMGAA
jgi:glycosyltransferase involved in cell wall biosynthesis